MRSEFIRQFFFLPVVGMIIVSGRVHAGEIMIEYPHYAEEHANRVVEEIQSIDATAVVSSCLRSTCVEQVGQLDNKVKFSIRVRKNLVEIRASPKGIRISDELMLLPGNYVPIGNYRGELWLDKHARVLLLSALIYTKPEKDNSQLYNLLGDTYFELSNCSQSKISTFEIIAYPDTLEKQCTWSFLQLGVSSYVASNTCSTNPECRLALARGGVLLSYFHPEEIRETISTLIKGMEYFKHPSTTVMVKKRAVELGLMNKGYEGLCRDVDVIFSNQQINTELQQHVRESLECR